MNGHHHFEPSPLNSGICEICGADKGHDIHLIEAMIETATGAKRSNEYPPGAKFPARYDLMMHNAVGMRRVAETWGEGAAKYPPGNWMKGFKESVYVSHMLEHLRLYLAGDKTEDHLGHLCWNAMALMWTEENKPELMDLPKVEQKV